VDDLRFGAAIRAARIRRGWRQLDLAVVAGVSRTTVARIEAGHLEELTLATMRGVANALDVRIELLARSRGAELDRLVNARHGALTEFEVRFLKRLSGWDARPEVSFSIWGERGVVDVLAWHAATRAVVVIELKTAIIDVGELLGTLDRKRRLGAQIAETQGWRAKHVSVVLMVGEGSTNRRRVREHAATFRSVLPDDGRRWRRWLARPEGTVNVLTFVSDVRRGNVTTGFAAIQRVSTRSRAGAAPGHARISDRAPPSAGEAGSRD
jgi:transcriptional regulator with XRE-family HTH domain